MRMIVGIGIGIVISFTTLFLIGVLITPELWVLLTSSGVIASLIYFLKIFPNIVFIVPENKAWIMSNSFVNESALALAKFSGNRDVRAQKEFQAGLHWKYPWETKAEDGEIDMKRIIPIISNPNETYTLRDGKTVEIKYQVLIVPLPGNIINFFRTREEDIIRKVRARAEKFFQGYMGERDSVEFGKKELGHLKTAFEKEWGGPNTIDPEERELGVWTGTPEVFDIGNPKDVEDARNFERQMDSVIKAANKMVKKSKGVMPFAQAMKMALVGRGQAKIDFVELSGALPLAAQGRKKKGDQNDNN